MQSAFQRLKKVSIHGGKNHKKLKETRSWFFEKINKIDKPLAKLRKNTEITSIRNERLSLWITWINHKDNKKNMNNSMLMNLIT